MEQYEQEADADNISTEAARESAAGLDENIAKAEKEIMQTVATTQGSRSTQEEDRRSAAQVSMIHASYESRGELFNAGFGLAQVNRFDEDYRTRQAETGMRWGKESFQLVAKHLIRTGTPANHGKRQTGKRSACTLIAGGASGRAANSGTSAASVLRPTLRPTIQQKTELCDALF
uniref:Yae1_N domain-containing protein n=1 Tax=Macrostomum lignano TaxID=282301 RepID=A0A1I8HXW9_9PLAT